MGLVSQQCRRELPAEQLAVRSCDPRRSERGLGPFIVAKESGVLFFGVEHDGNIQQSDEEVEQVKAIYEQMLGRA